MDARQVEQTSDASVLVEAYFDFDSFPASEDTTFGPFDTSTQLGSVDYSSDAAATGIMNDQMFSMDFPSTSNTVQYPQEQPILQTDTFQTPFMPMVNEQQYGQWPQNAVDGRYRLSGMSLSDPYAELYPSQLVRQPVQGAGEQGVTMTAIVIKIP